MESFINPNRINSLKSLIVDVNICSFFLVTITINGVKMRSGKGNKMRKTFSLPD